LTLVLVWPKTKVQPDSTTVCWEFPMQDTYLVI